ncbi:MAG: chemotaxis protein CheA [Deltaproteobacteria bacterium]|nr:chemotaxis protein CheA [Deltaproteobacteria bacterium]
MNSPQSFKDAFIAEAEDLLVEIEECVLDIETNPEDMDAINRLFRAMHTIKGSGAMFGFEDIASFTHHVETALDFVREGKLKISTKLINMVLKSRDHIKAMLEHSQGGPVVRASQTEDLIKVIESLIPNKLKNQPPRETIVPSMLPKTPTPVEKVFRISVKPNENIFSFGMDPALLVEELRQLGECTVTPYTGSIPTLDQIAPVSCYIHWDIILFTNFDENAVRDVFIFVEDECETKILDISDNRDDIPKVGEILVSKGDTTKEQVEDALRRQSRIGDLLAQTSGIPKERIKSALAEQKTLERKKAASQQETVKVAAEKLDALVNLVGELVIVQAQLSSISRHVNAPPLQTSVEEIERLISELRDVALNVRMMPIGTTFAKFRRLVRDLSSELGKEIKLETEGAETEMDKTVLDKLGDPLVHLIRNSIDHGVESPDVRLASGKPSTGTIRLAAQHRGAKVVISITDDGKGLDVDKILKKAQERQLIPKDADLSEREIYNLIMAPGFSTAEQVSQVSGRGVGMDVVKKQIEALRGSVSIQSDTGKGTHIELSLPLTLAIIDGLLVEVDEDKYVIPVNSVEECLELTESSKAMDKSRNLLKVRGELVPFVRLREVFGIKTKESKLEEAVVVEMGDSRIGIVVDRIVGDHQTVIKSLGHLYRNVQGVSGATIMGDGNVALIVDIPSLASIANIDEQQHLQQNRSVIQ